MTLEGALVQDQNDNAAQVFMLGNLGVNLALSSSSSVFNLTQQSIVLICNVTGTAGHVQAFASGDATATTATNGALVPAGGAVTFGIPAGFVLRTSSATNVTIIENYPGAGS